ncbi:MAG: HAD-IA family hydrolase [Chloroflexi bacterium]|nr:HAD-IA family hydrolase [Chloroflexota bacterium]
MSDTTTETTPTPATVAADEAVGSVRAVAFDCYGTLLKLEEREFAALIQEMLHEHGVNHASGDEVWEAWLEASREMVRRDGRNPERPLEGPEPPFRPFSETWPFFFGEAFQRHSVETIPPMTAFQHLWDVLSVAPAYPEVAPVLAELQARGYRVAIGSNADDDHLVHALDLAGIEVELVLSSEEAQSYKPRKPFFEQLCARLQLEPCEVLYVGDSPWADVTGANHAGLPVFWVSRYPDPDREKMMRATPTWSGPDLTGILEALPSSAPA